MSLASSFASPLRYPGGKGRLAAYLSELLTMNGLLGCEFFEPFAGGAGVGLKLLKSGCISRLHLNDLDPAVHAFWHTALYDTEWLMDQILEAKLTVDHWRYQQWIWRERAEHVEIQHLGFAALYLNRTSRSGIMGAGVIGGVDQTGSHSMDARFNKKLLAERVRAVAHFRDRITLSREDATVYLGCALTKNGFVYLDPPYRGQGKALYRHAFEWQDHERLYDAVGSLTLPWMMSYDANISIWALYGDYEMEHYELPHSTNLARPGREMLIFSDGLKRPDTIKPSRGAVRLTG